MGIAHPAQRRTATAPRALRYALLFALLGVISFGSLASAEQPPEAAADSFSRFSATLAGVRQIEAAYTATERWGAFGVRNGVGRLFLNTGVRAGHATLSHVVSRDVEVRFRVSLNRAMVSSGSAVSVWVRRDSAGNGYRAKLTSVSPRVVGIEQGLSC